MKVVDRVLIAGAGPVGLVAALGLSRRGIPVTVFEALDDLPLDLRASTIHPPTLEMLEELGVIERVLSHGTRSPLWQYRDRATGPVAIFDLTILSDETKYPFRAQFEQYKLTRYILETLAGYPDFKIEFGHRAVEVRQDADSAILTLETKDGRKDVTGRYVIAADGSSSPLRKSLGLTFEGYTFPERYLQVSTHYKLTDLMPDLSPVNYISDPKEWLALLNVGGLWRMMFPTDTTRPDAELMSDDVIQDHMQRVADIGRPYDVVHRTLYTIHQRVTPTYNVGRVLLAGDAAHINNPLGGMGMNGGIHDAYNLVGKLAAVWEGGDPSLLDLYTRQRRAIALEDVQRLTVRNREIMRETDPAVRKKNHDELRRAAETPELAKQFLLKSSMLASVRQSNAIA